MMSNCPTIVTCIESGSLEKQVFTMVRSLRRNGHRLSKAKVIAVTPRLGVPLSAGAQREMAELDIQHVIGRPVTGYAWNGFMNKPLTLLLAQKHIQTKYALWLDGDIIVSKEPSLLIDDLESDFMYCVEEMGPISDGVENKFDPFWVKLGEVLKLDADKLPWVNAPFSDRKLRAYCNSGVFRYKLGIGLEQRYFDAFKSILDSRIVPKDDPSIFLHEQIALAQIAIYHFKSTELPTNYNFHAGKEYEHFYPAEEMKDAVFIHYHRVIRSDATRKHFFDNLYASGREDIVNLFRNEEIGLDNRPAFYIILNKLLNRVRRYAEKKHYAKIIKI
jgi:hypothetical protein